MNKRTLVAILGIVVAIIPLLGLPGIWKKQIFVVLGIAITYLALSRTKKKTLIEPEEVHNMTSIEVAPVELEVEAPAPVSKPRVRRKPTVIAAQEGEKIQ